ncbi:MULTISPECIES: hypothetical protein [unclassified Asaia]|nr:hypothetical protein [Asaia sp. W19]
MTTRHILCFGDSLTWGWMPVPSGTPSTRYAGPESWPVLWGTASG